jgi:hypothetical protein
MRSLLLSTIILSQCTGMSSVFASQDRDGPDDLFNSRPAKQSRSGPQDGYAPAAVAPAQAGPFNAPAHMAWGVNPVPHYQGNNGVQPAGFTAAIYAVQNAALVRPTAIRPSPAQHAQQYAAPEAGTTPLPRAFARRDNNGGAFHNLVPPGGMPEEVDIAYFQRTGIIRVLVRRK